jgi:hypothetical protein
LEIEVKVQNSQKAFEGEAKLKVLVSDKLADVGIKMFEEADGIEVDVNVGLAPEELKAIIGDYDALVIRSATKVTVLDWIMWLSVQRPREASWS